MVRPASPSRVTLETEVAVDRYRREVLRATTALLSVLLTAALAASLVTVASAAAAPRKIAYAEWQTTADLNRGVLEGTKVVKGRLAIDRPIAHRTYRGRRYDVARWTSPWTSPDFRLTELIASWDATTPGNSFVEVQVRGRPESGRASSWDVLGRWASRDRSVRRTSVPGQGDDLARVNVDTWQTKTGAGLASWRLRVILLRGTGSPGPRVDGVGAVASRLPNVSGVATSQPGPGSGTTLAVPRYSQMAHSGHYPRWGGGGQAWCSPTATSMVLGYYDRLPPRGAYAWVPDQHPAPWVDYAARMTYDADYGGTGNWPFNTAYAATRTEHAFVTRLRNLREAGSFIEAGIPLVASISFGSGQLDGAPISASNGHLLVIVGFTNDGDVVVNDPAARTKAGVRRTYDRGQFEDAWIPTSGGVVYVIRNQAHPLPGSAPSNW